MNLQNFYSKSSLKVFSYTELEKLQNILQIKLNQCEINNNLKLQVQERLDRIVWEMIRRVKLENAKPQTPPKKKYFN